MNQSQPDFSVHCGYDLNGNITSLRRGGSGAYDVLTMGYEGNRLTSVTDCGNDNLLGEVPQLAAGGAASGRWWQPFPRFFRSLRLAAVTRVFMMVITLTGDTTHCLAIILFIDNL